MNTFRIPFLVLVLFVSLTSCSDEAATLTGQLKVTITNTAILSDLDKPKIFALENTDYPILEDLSFDARGTLVASNLNYGNYLIMFRTKNYALVGQKAFQIHPGKTTTLYLTL